MGEGSMSSQSNEPLLGFREWARIQNARVQADSQALLRAWANAMEARARRAEDALHEIAEWNFGRYSPSPDEAEMVGVARRALEPIGSFSCAQFDEGGRRMTLPDQNISTTCKHGRVFCAACCSATGPCELCGGSGYLGDIDYPPDPPVRCPNGCRVEEKGNNLD